jgi:hypothetical protein
VRQQLGGLDILVNNGSLQQLRQSLIELESEDFDATMKTNIYAMFWLTKAALLHMKPGSTIIQTTSEQAYDPSANLVDYAMTKAAEMSFTKSMAKQLGPKGIRVNGVAPGTIWTPLQVSGGATQNDLQKFGGKRALALLDCSENREPIAQALFAGGIKIGRDVLSGLPVQSQIRHGCLRIDLARVHDPLHDILRAIRSDAGHKHVAAYLRKVGPHPAGCRCDAGDAVARPAAGADDGVSAAVRITISLASSDGALHPGRLIALHHDGGRDADGKHDSHSRDCPAEKAHAETLLAGRARAITQSAATR